MFSPFLPALQAWRAGRQESRLLPQRLPNYSATHFPIRFSTFSWLYILPSFINHQSTIINPMRHATMMAIRQINVN
jgi:hypothetical protein